MKNYNIKSYINAIEKFDPRFIKFLFVGGINASFGFSVYAFLIFLKFHYPIAVFFSTAMGVLFNFKTTGKIVFENSDNRLLLKFVAVYSIIYVLNVLGIGIIKAYGINSYIAGALLVLPLAIISFCLNRKFVFKGN